MPEFEELKRYGEIVKSDRSKIVVKKTVRRGEEPYLDIRTFVDTEEYTGPTKKGVTLDGAEDIKKLRDALEEAINDFE